MGIYSGLCWGVGHFPSFILLGQQEGILLTVKWGFLRVLVFFYHWPVSPYNLSCQGYHPSLIS